MLYIELALFGYLLSAALGFVNKKISYGAGLLSSLILLAAVFYSGQHPYILNILQISSNISLSLKLDKLSSIFIAISSISWIAITLFSLDFGNFFRKRMAILINLDMLGILLTLTAYDAFTFLIGYEIMTITSYMLIVEKNCSFKGAFGFLAFSELSTIALIAAFVSKYSLDNSIYLTAGTNSSIFLFFASLAFVIKMDIVPFHTWLKDAYSKAPSSVLAILSGSITLVGTYGIFRVLSISHASHTWGLLAIAIGAFSAFWGATQAAASKEIHTLPAYSTIENNSLILSLLGLHALSLSSLHTGSTLAVFAYIGAIMLTFAHSISKTLLFLSIGHAKRLLNEDKIDNIRGIHASVGKIPACGIVVSGLSFSAFPPLIGYVAEWIILESIFQSYQFSNIFDRIISSSSGVFMALAMGFATFSMIKLIGYSALGYNHEKTADHTQSTLFMNSAQVFLMATIFLGGILATYEFTYLGGNQFIIGALAVPQGFLLASAKPVFGVIAPLFYAIVITVFIAFVSIIYLYKKRSTKSVTSWNGGLELKKDEYFTTSAYSFTIEYILRFIYLTKEIKNKNGAFVILKDIFDYIYGFITLSVRKTALYVSRILMSGKVYQYIAYLAVMFIISFIIF
jgi:hydrogenase-4 component B